ncbi:MAG: adenylyltransferase/cytidyltransferase family protein [Endozoicomonas sp.]
MNELKFGVFGSAFDPPTLGHLDVLQQAAGHHDRILLVPSANHAFGKQPQPFEVRLEMLRRFVKEASVACSLEVCDLERRLLAANPDHSVYTYDLLEALEAHYLKTPQRVVLSFIRGPDNAHPETWSRFYKAREIEARWPVYTARERLGIRSSQVRSLLESFLVADGHCVADSLDNDLPEKRELRLLEAYLLPSVLAYIVDHGLYL